ncbi:hypothetical protein [Mesorhizobium sp. L2C066B000]|uniref:hypothetical protein n=1 Tax=Mesorhizobium sp. L2C066B000 TaxID=1287105 RepID=UPI0012DE6AB9|nr:hypothetical protein [Mesorhizobium sp. L2C066B000]
MRKPAGPINESLSRPEIYVLSVTEGIAEKQRLMDHFRARPFANCGRAKFFRSPDFRVDFNLRYLVLNSGVAALNGGWTSPNFSIGPTSTMIHIGKHWTRTTLK